MKKIFILALCAAAVAGANAQKSNVDYAKKNATKEPAAARAAIQEAMKNPETSADPNTYVIAADIELKAYDKQKAALGLNPSNAEDAQIVEMDGYLVKAYPLLKKIGELSANDPKGKALKEMQNRMVKYSSDYWQAGADLYGKDFDKAYDAFMAYGEIPTLDYVQGKVLVPDTIRATSFYNAGLCGWSIPDLPRAAEAFKQARLAGYNEPNAYIYELACWQNMMQSDSTLTAQAQQDIYETSKDAYERFGLSQPVFINNMVNVLAQQNKEADALNLLNEKLGETPDSPTLYSLRAFVNNRLGNEEAAINDYRKVGEAADADFESLVAAARNIYRVGAEKWNNIEGASPEQRKDIRDNYFQVAKNITERAKAAKGEKDSTDQLDYVIEQVDYALESLK